MGERIEHEVGVPSRDLPPESFFTVHQWDARDVDTLLGPYSPSTRPLITTTITSPPYGGLKNYGHPDQIGYGHPHDEYLVDCKRVFRSLYKHTRDDGSLWLIADTLRLRDSEGSRLRPLPFELAAQAEGEGWTLRDVVIWKKDKTLPWSGKGRLRNTFEYILFLTKSDSFKYRIDRLREPETLKEWWVKWPERYNPLGKVPTNVWEHSIPVQGSWKESVIQHACPLPPDLVERLIFLSTDEGDVVFDPFAGTGVVVAEAERLGRRGVGTELVKKYVTAYNAVVKPQIQHRRGEDRLQNLQRKTEILRDTILRLRALKYPKVLIKEVLRKHPSLQRVALAVVLVDSLDPSALREPHKLIDTRTFFVTPAPADAREDSRRALKELSLQQPASKFGVTGEINVVAAEDLPHILADQHDLYLYEEGRTWTPSTGITADEVAYLALWPSRYRFPPIIANIFVDAAPQDANVTL